MPKMYKTKNGNLIGDVIFEDNEGCLIQWRNSTSWRNFWCHADIKNSLYEYKEPVVEKFVRYLRPSSNPNQYYTDIKPCSKDVGGFEFTITDGKLTDVKVLE